MVPWGITACRLRQPGRQRGEREGPHPAGRREGFGEASGSASDETRDGYPMAAISTWLVPLHAARTSLPSTLCLAGGA